MCAEKFEKSKEYSKARGVFNDLGVEEQAAFIAESMVNMIVKSVRTAGDAVSRAFEEVKADMNGEEKAAAGEGQAKKTAKSGEAKKASGKKGSAKTATTGAAKSSGTTGKSKKAPKSEPE